MKKGIAIIIAIIGFGIGATAQDIITLRSGNEVKAIIREVGIDVIKFKKFENQTGPTYVLKKSAVFMISYANGSKDVFNETDVTPEEKIQLKTPQPARPVLSYSNKVMKDGVRLRPALVRRVMSVDSDALSKYNCGRGVFVAGQIITYPMAFIFGWNLGQLLVGNFNDRAFAIGTIGFVGGITISLIGESQMRSSVRIFNANGQNSTSYKLNFGVTPNGLGLCLRF